MKDFNAVRTMLRTRAWVMYTPRLNALKRANTSRTRYKCERCGEYQFKQNVEVHHIKFVGRWNKNGTADEKIQYFERLFCSEDDLQVLCKECHKEVHDLARERGTDHSIGL